MDDIKGDDDRNQNRPELLPEAGAGKDERPDPGRLHNIAAVVLAQVQKDPPPWFQEWAGFTLSALGPPPNRRLGQRGHENWNLVAMGILIAFGYFGEMLLDPEEGTDGAADRIAGPDDPGERQEASAAPAPTAETPRPALTPPTFTILGWDGQPLVEGLK